MSDEQDTIRHDMKLVVWTRGPLSDRWWRELEEVLRTAPGVADAKVKEDWV